MEKSSTLEKEQDRLLARLSDVLGQSAFYLAGGTAVALHLHHRVSRDLDLFSRSPRADLASVRRRLTRSFREAEVISASSTSLEIRIGSVAVDIVKYPYAPLEPPGKGPHDFPVAGLSDLAAMKLAAIGGAGCVATSGTSTKSSEAGSPSKMRRTRTDAASGETKRTCTTSPAPSRTSPTPRPIDCAHRG